LESLKKILNPIEQKWLDKEDGKEQGKIPSCDEKSVGNQQFYFSRSTRTYIREISHNVVRVNEMLDAYKEICQTLETRYSSAQDQRSNSNLYMLSVVSVIFLPISFLAGVYGTNFHHVPETQWDFGYLYYWILTLFILGITLGTLKYKKMI